MAHGLDEGSERSIAGGVLGADAADQQQRMLARTMEQNVEQRQRLFIAPLHIIQMEQERAGHSLDRMHDRLQEALLPQLLVIGPISRSRGR